MYKILIFPFLDWFHRKGSSTWEDQAEISNKNKHMAPPQPPSPEKYELKPTHHHQLSPPYSGEILSNLRDNLNNNTGSTVPSSDFFPSSPFGFFEDYQQLHFPDHFDNELMQIYSPPFISPETSESKYFTEWVSSPSLDFSAELADVDLDFKFDNSFF